NVTATTFSDTRIDLGWTAAPGATGYRVLRGTVSGGPYAQVGTPTGTSFSDTGLTANTSYFYVVDSTSAGGVSSNSTEVSTTTAPAAVTDLAATALDDTHASLSWTTSAGATSYTVFRKLGAGTFSQVGTATTGSFPDSSLVANSTYFYFVLAVSGNGT